MGLLDFFNGANLLITGVTGFLGKIVIEKILRSLPHVNKIYVLVREKKGSSTMERFKKEVLGSQCFDVLRKSSPNFQELISSKIQTIPGDLSIDGLGLSPENRALLVNNVDIIINMAASIDFQMRLDEALNINVYGPLRMLELAREMKKLRIFLHVSTSYVNSDKHGVLIEEKIYEAAIDPDDSIKEIKSIPPNMVHHSSVSS